MFSFEDMLKKFVEGEGEDESSLREQIISKGTRKEKNFQYLKFNEGLSGSIVYAVCKNQSTHQLEPIQYALNPRL
jgi:hypothetical protein